MIPSRHCGTFVKGKRIGSAGEIHQDRVVRPLRCIIFSQLAPKASSLHANGGIQMGIKITRAPEDLRRNLIFLGRGSWMVQCVVGQVAQQLAQRLGTMQGMAAEKFLDLSPIMSLVRHFPYRPGPDIVTLHE